MVEIIDILKLLGRELKDDGEQAERFREFIEQEKRNCPRKKTRIQYFELSFKFFIRNPRYVQSVIRNFVYNIG